MLNYKNKEDREKMMRYHRCKDMINLLHFFPDLSPITELVVVESIEDYLENQEFCKRLPGERNDTLITKPMMPSIEGRGIDVDVLSIFKTVKEMDADGVMILFDLCHEASERCSRYAGISVGISVGNGVLIDAVGKGFDGREVSKGIDCHERFYIPWFELRKCNIDNFRDYRNYIISDTDYKISREKRVEFLLSLGINSELIEKEVPKTYCEIPDFIWKDVIKNLIKKLERYEDELITAGLKECVINGQTEGRKYLPWQLFDSTRY